MQKQQQRLQVKGCSSFPGSAYACAQYLRALAYRLSIEQRQWNNSIISTHPFFLFLFLLSGSLVQIRLGDIYHLARSMMSGKTFALPTGWWPHEASRRLAVLCVTTVALLFARLQIMGSQLPVFTR